MFEPYEVLYNLEKGRYLRMPGGVVHEAWFPAGSQTLDFEESGWAVDWLHSGPSVEEADQHTEATALIVDKRMFEGLPTVIQDLWDDEDDTLPSSTKPSEQ